MLLRRLPVLAILLMACDWSSFAQTGALNPSIYPVWVNANGVTPVALGFICTTASGGTTLLATYLESTNTNANQNPIRLNASGRAVNGSTLVPIFLGPTQYRITLYAAGTGNTCGVTTVGALILQRDNVYDLAELFTVQFNSKNIEQWRFADQFAGATTTNKIDAAITDCASVACVVVIPSTMGAGAPTTIPNNATIWDFRSNGRLSIRTNPTSVGAGYSGGLSIRMGVPTLESANPPAGSPVALFIGYDSTSLNASSGAAGGLFGINVDGGIVTGKDAFHTAIEADSSVGTGISDVSDVYSGLAKFAMRSSSGGAVRNTAAYSIDSGNTAAGFHAGISCTTGSCTDTFLLGAPQFAVWAFTEAITAGTRTVKTTYNTAAGNGLHPFGGIHVGAGGGTKEDTNIAAAGIVTSGTSTLGATCTAAAACITATFAQNHPTPNFLLYAYGTVDGFHFSSANSSSVGYIGSVQEQFTTADSSVPLGFTVGDSSGTKRYYQYFDSSNVQRFRDIGGGITVENLAGTSNMFSVTSKGVSNNDYGMKHARLAAGSTCSTAAAAGATCTFDLTWGTAFADASYTPVCSIGVVGTGVPTVGSITPIASKITVTIVAGTAAAANGQIFCIALHDPS